ncbi:MAG TPA: FkbM family methyltransferase [Actinomycetota bacterium]|nr:FkbM family methyltransferase [Actinomycetota bacterium]
MTVSFAELPAVLRAAEDRVRALHEELARGVTAVDEALAAIDRDRDAADEALDAVPAIGRRLAGRLAAADVSAPAVPLDGPGWEPVPVAVGDGLAFTVMLDTAMHDPVTAGLATGRTSDEPLIALMLEFVQPGDWVIDLGAHVGTFSLAAAARGCGVLAIEASPANAALLRASAARNGFHDLRVIHCAATDTAGPLSFEANGPWGHMTWGGEGETHTVTVPGVPIDQLLGAFASPPPAFIKMDVEGAELKAIAGMRALLSGPGAPPVLFESNGHALALAGATPNELQACFEELGYATYLIEGRRLTRLSPDEVQVVTVADCLAMKRRPAGLDAWEVRIQSTEEDALLRITAEAAHPNPDCRAYAARALEGLDPELLSHPLVTGALADLRADADPVVVAAAAWSHPGEGAQP